MATITIRQLIRAGACAEQRAKFRALFGTSVEVTEELAIQHAKTFDWDWAAVCLLPEDAREAYRQAKAIALEAHGRATASAWEAYDQAKAIALEAYEWANATAEEPYDQAKETAWEAYDRATASARVAAWEDYERATASAREAYDRAKAIAFAGLYIQHCDKGR